MAPTNPKALWDTGPNNGVCLHNIPTASFRLPNEPHDHSLANR